MAPTSAVTTFNSLPRPSSIQPTHPSTTLPPTPPNHWHISIQSPSITPPDDLLFLLQPSTGYIHVGSPTSLSKLPTAAQAERIAPMLLEAFNEGLGGYVLERRNGQQGKVKLFAPMSWSVNDRALAEALGNELKKLKVRKELKAVGVGDAAEQQKAQAEWDAFAAKLTSFTFGDLKE